jgi:hypothetical protein
MIMIREMALKSNELIGDASKALCTPPMKQDATFIYIQYTGDTKNRDQSVLLYSKCNPRLLFYISSLARKW